MYEGISLSRNLARESGREREAARTPIQRVALVGNSSPRRCGLATFTTNAFHALRTRYRGLAIDVYAMNDRPQGYRYPCEVRGTVDQDSLADYISAARMIERSNSDVLWLQHEYGIFGGAAGSYILTLLDQVSIPVVVTLHTVLAEPNDEQHKVMDALIRRGSTLVVMAEHGRKLLVNNYGADPDQIELVLHGVPDRPFGAGEEVKRRERLVGKDVLMTFGLLSPNKGIERMIEALPAIVARFPKALYLVVGATHPNLVASEGEAYRERLKSLASQLGVDAHIRWVDEFLDAEDLLDLLSAADIYVTPYLNPAQITSGTLAYAVALGKAVISTPYIHARELLGDGYGRLVPFGDSGALAAEVINLLSHPHSCEELRRKAYARGRTMLWPKLAEAMMAIFQKVASDNRRSGLAMDESKLETWEGVCRSDDARLLTS